MERSCHDGSPMAEPMPYEEWRDGDGPIVLDEEASKKFREIMDKRKRIWPDDFRGFGTNVKPRKQK